MEHDGCRQQEITCRVCGGDLRLLTSNEHCRPGMCDACYRELGKDLGRYSAYIESQSEEEDDLDTKSPKAEKGTP